MMHGQAVPISSPVAAHLLELHERAGFPGRDGEVVVGLDRSFIRNPIATDRQIL